MSRIKKACGFSLPDARDLYKARYRQFRAERVQLSLTSSYSRTGFLASVGGTAGVGGVAGTIGGAYFGNPVAGGIIGGGAGLVGGGRTACTGSATRSQTRTCFSMTRSGLRRGRRVRCSG